MNGEGRFQASTCARSLGFWGWAELLTRTLPSGLSKADLESPSAPRHMDCGLVRERSKGIWS